MVVKHGTVLGPGNLVFEGAVLGGLPQHVNIPENPGRLTIGAGNTIRENVTFHRALQEDGETVIGDNNLFMVNTHIAHDCRIGNHTIFTNNSMLAGHVTIGDRAYLSGAAAAHQFCRIGAYAMVGGQAHINKDVPPFVTLDGLSSHVVGLNSIGLRRAGFTSQQDQPVERGLPRDLSQRLVLERYPPEAPRGLQRRTGLALSVPFDDDAASWPNAACRQASSSSATSRRRCPDSYRAG